MKRQNTTRNIEQLWAIQSTEHGAAPIIIAASEYFSDKIDLIEQIKPYLLYALPAGCTPQTLRKDDAPINLSFFIIGQNRQRVLLYKSYAVQATNKQPGTYFIHLLTNLPAGFSAKQAILLWRSPFWQQTIKKWASPDFSRTQGTITLLQSVSINKLNVKRKPNFADVDMKKINHYLSYVSQTHFLQQQKLQDSQKIPRLYLAATPDEVAYLLYTFLHLLPKQLIKGIITFSTYEQNIANNPQYLVIGTYSLTDARPTNGTSDVIPKQFYAKEFALNYITGDVSRLPDTPSKFLVYYARYSARCYRNKDMKKLDKFLKQLETIQNLNFISFVDKYQEFLNESNYPLSTLNQLLTEPASTLLRTLGNKDIRAGIIDCALIERGQFLAQFTQRLGLIIQNGKQKNLLLLENDISEALVQAAETNNPDFFLAALSLLESLLPSVDTWISLLYKLVTEIPIIKRDWKVREALLLLIYGIFNTDEQKKQEYWPILSQLLKSINLEDLSLFLALTIPSDWLFMTTIPGIEHFAFHVDDREKLEHTLKEYGGYGIRTINYADTILSLFKCVIYNGCINKLPLMFSMLDYPSDQPVSKETLEKMYASAYLNVEEQEIFLGHYSTIRQPDYHTLYPEALCWQQTPFLPQPIQTLPGSRSREIQQPVRTQVNRDDFLAHLTFTIDTMSKLADMIHKDPAGTIHPVAKALVGCIEDAFQLSIAISTIATVCGNNYSHSLLQEMFTRINTIYRQIIQTTSEASPESLRSKLLLAAYTHYTFEFVLFFYNDDQNIVLALLQILLQDSNAETLKFLNEVSTTWSSSAQNQWQNLEPQLHRLPMQLPPISEATYKNFVSPDLQNVYTKEMQQAFQSIRATLNRKGVKSLALVWLQQRMTLIQHLPTFQSEEWRRIQTASAFYVACQEADASEVPDLVAERAILEAATHLHQDNLTKSEKKRVDKARSYFDRNRRNTSTSSAAPVPRSLQSSKQHNQKRIR